MVKPYERDISRVRALFRLPAASNGRILELCFDSEPLFDGVSTVGEVPTTCLLWNHLSQANKPSITSSGQLACIADYRRQLPFVAESFDLVFMHDGLDRLACVLGDHEPEV